MKCSLLIILLLICMLTKAGVQDSSMQVVRLNYEQVLVSPLDLSEGKGHLWNLCNMDKLKTLSYERIFRNDSTIVDVFDGSIYKYKENGSCLELLRCEQPTWWLAYSSPISMCEGRADLWQSDSCTFSSRGVYCGKYAISQAGKYISSVVAAGTLVLSEEDTLQNVFLQHEQLSSDMLFYNDSAISSTPAKMSCMEENYQWKIVGFPYPLLVSKKQTVLLGGQIVFQNRKFFVLRLSPDINEKIVKTQKQNTSGVEDGHKSQVISECDISCDENNQVKVTLDVKQSLRATVILSTLRGMLLRRKTWQCQSSQQNEILLDCSGLSRGQYVISIEVGGDMASKKFIVK